MFRKILVAYDGSAGARRALDTALELARVHDAELWALAVEERLPHFAATVDEVDEEKEFANHFYGKRLDEAREHAARANLELQTLVRAGHAVQTIVEVAKAGAFDLIVLGHSGHSELWATLLGATAERVSRYAPCTVMIVR